MTPSRCLSCDHAGPLRELIAREMMFGWREKFPYEECPACESLQIRAVPADLGRFYPSDYCSQQVPAGMTHQPSRARAFVARWLTRPPFAPFTRLFRERYPFLHWARLGGITQSGAVLDVGCGAGVMLRRMRRWGYTQLTGVDPYLGTELHETGIDLYRRELGELTGRFDLISLHHVLEHLPDPLGSLRLAVARLAPGGRLLVRLPLAAGPIPREYGIDWFNLDAPRHLVIPSRVGFQRLIERAGLKIVHEEYDGAPYSLFYSECYRRNVAMRETVPPEAAPIDRRMRRRMAQLNAAGLGDYGSFVLEPAAPPRPPSSVF